MTRRIVSFTGNNGVGIISNSEFKLGDKVAFVIDSDGNVGGNFAPFIAVDGELIQTSSANLSASACTALLT